MNRYSDQPVLLDRLVVACLVAAIVLVPVLNLALPEQHLAHVDTFNVTQLGKFLALAMLALSVDLIWGYLGILSLGHGAFFALGGYAMGMYLMRQIGDRGVYGNPDLPDFMVFLSWDEVPWFWTGMEHFPLAMIAVVLAPGLLAFIFGWFTFRSRVNGVYLSIITQAMTFALMLAFYRNEMGFGGNNGLTDFKDIVGFSLREQSTRVALFVVSGVTLLAAFTLCQRIVRSRAGRVAQAIRDSEARTRFIGFNVESYKVFLFTLSAVLAGIAGALYVPQAGIINPREMAPLGSIEVVVWVALGGRGTLYGPIIGALIVNYAKSWFTVVLPELWIFALGILFVFSTLFLPRGITGLFRRADK